MRDVKCKRKERQNGIGDSGMYTTEVDERLMDIDLSYITNVNFGVESAYFITEDIVRVCGVDNSLRLRGVFRIEFASRSMYFCQHDVADMVMMVGSIGIVTGFHQLLLMKSVATSQLMIVFQCLLQLAKIITGFWEGEVLRWRINR